MTKNIVATMTLPLDHNYGGILQAYALQQTILSLGFETLLIHNDVSHYPNWRKRKTLIKQHIRKLVNGKPIDKQDFTSVKQKKIIDTFTREFVEENIKKTDLVSTVFDYSDIEKYGFNNVVVGSDQVWRTSYTKSISSYFCDFLVSEQSINKISYAASFGVDDWTFSTAETSKCKNLLKTFKAVSVREDSGVDLCREKFEVEAKRVLDPTFLVPKEKYIELVNKKNLPTPDGKLFCYVLDRSEDKQQMERKAATFLNTKLFHVMPRKDMENLNSNNIEEFIFPPVEHWLQGFMHADYVITDSFHGTVFSILFKKNFIAIGNKRRGLSRFTSILKQFDLMDRLILEPEEFHEEKLVEEIDWDSVYAKLDLAKKDALAFLKANM